MCKVCYFPTKWHAAHFTAGNDASLTAKCQQGKTAIDYAKLNKRKAVIQLFEDFLKEDEEVVETQAMKLQREAKVKHTLARANIHTNTQIHTPRGKKKHTHTHTHKNVIKISTTIHFYIPLFTHYDLVLASAW